MKAGEDESISGCERRKEEEERSIPQKREGEAEMMPPPGSPRHKPGEESFGRLGGKKRGTRLTWLLHIGWLA